MKLKPIGDRVLIKPKEVETKTKSGIYIPESAQEKNQEGEIVALGTAKDFPVKVGEIVLYEKYAGTDLDYEDAKYVILNTKDIIGVVTR